MWKAECRDMGAAKLSEIAEAVARTPSWKPNDGRLKPHLKIQRKGVDNTAPVNWQKAKVILNLGLKS